MGKQWIVCLMLLGMGIAHCINISPAFAADDPTIKDALPLDQPNAAPGPGTADAAQTPPAEAPPAELPPAHVAAPEHAPEHAPVESAEHAPPAPPAESAEYKPAQEDPAEFSPAAALAQETSPDAKPKQNPNDENIDYKRILKRLEGQELTKAYRHHALGTEGYRPNTIAVGVGGRMPGYGIMFDYSWNRLGFGAAASFRPDHSYSYFKGYPSPQGDSEYYGNAYAFYNWIPFDVSPFLLVGLEYAYNTPSTVNVIAGLGVEARIWGSMTLFVEYVRHETVKVGFAGLALGYAF